MKSFYIYIYIFKMYVYKYMYIMCVYMCIYNIRFILPELFRGKERLLEPSAFKFSIQMSEWPSYLDCLIKCRMLHIAIFYHMEPLIWVGLQFIHSFPLNERQYYYHFSMTTTWHAFDYVMSPSEWPSSSTDQRKPNGSNKICMLNTDD